MKTALLTLTAMLLLASSAVTQTSQEVEPYLLAPYTLHRMVSLTLADYSKLEGKVVSGDDEKIVVVDAKGRRTEVPVGNIRIARFRRPRQSAKVEFLGSLIGGIGLGFAGATLGKHAGEAIRSDGQPGRIGPIVGGVGLGFLGGYLGKLGARHMTTENVVLTVTPEPAPRTH